MEAFDGLKSIREQEKREKKGERESKSEKNELLLFYESLNSASRSKK